MRKLFNSHSLDSQEKQPINMVIYKYGDQENENNYRDS